MNRTRAALLMTLATGFALLPSLQTVASAPRYSCHRLAPSPCDVSVCLISFNIDGLPLNPRFTSDQKLTYKLISRVEVPQSKPDSAIIANPGDPADPNAGGDRRTTLQPVPAPPSTPAEPLPKPAPPEGAQPADAAVAAMNPVRYFLMEATIKLTTLGVDEQGNAAIIVLFTELHGETGDDGMLKAGLTLTGNGLTRSGTEQAPVESPQPPAPLPGTGAMSEDTPLAAVTSALMASTIRIDVRADGTISEVTGLEAAHAAAAKYADGARLLGPFAPGVVNRSLAAIFRVDEPDKAGKFVHRSPTDTWLLTDEWTIGATSTLVRTTTCTLDTLTPELARITAKGQASIRKTEVVPQEPPARPRRGARQPEPLLEPTVLIAQQSDASTVEWNPAEGVLVSRVRESSMTTRAQVGSYEGAAQEVRSRIELRLVK